MWKHRVLPQAVAFVVAIATAGTAAPARSDSVGGGSGSPFQTQLNQSVKDRDGAVIGALVDILVTPRSGQLIAVIQPPASKLPVAMPFTDLNFTGNDASIAFSGKEFDGLPKQLVVVGDGIQSKRFGRVPNNTGLLAVASVPVQELRFPALPNQAEPYVRAQTNLDFFWRHAFKPLQ